MSHRRRRAHSKMMAVAVAARSVRTAALAVLVLAAGCTGKKPEEEQAEPRAAAYSREFSGGPVSLTLRLDRTEITLADRITLEQELAAEEGFEAEFPEYLPEDFEGFSVVEIREGKPERKGNAVLRKKRLVLEPDRSGELAIAPLAVYFHRSGEKKESHFLTEEIQVKVEGIGELGSLALRPVRGIFAAPPRPKGWGILPWIGAALAVALLAVVLLKIARKVKKAAPPVPPHVLAMEALRRLVAMDLVGKGQIERFHVLLSAILRDYIERRFGLRAPERTTEEFLVEAARSDALQKHRVRLGEFLGHCDMVKFARFQPRDDEIQRSFDTLKTFLEETAVHGV